MATILPTHSCFDDSLEYITARAKQNPAAVEHLLLVHAICLFPEGQARAGQRFAHAWVECGGLVWDAGLLNGQRVWFAVNRDEYYAHMRVQECTRYTVREALEENRRAGNYGPWKEPYLSFCRGRRRS